MLRIRKGDTVFVITGKDKGKTGKVIRVLPTAGRVLVEGINRVKKATRRTREDQKGGIIEVELPIAISNLQIFCKNCSKPTRIGIKTEKALSKGKASKNKARFCKRCKEVI
ncbi:MAG: 50S ribosomal protein L24 [Candidatus Omnitrophota bacterium]|nr:50S ribosomal protein L24 [Candidatus Omnitrophota bacterium]